MLRLTLVRHASTAWNNEDRYQGWSDPPLSETGVGEASELRLRLVGERFDRVIASDLHRCLDTAVIAQPGAEVIPDPRWREMNFGVWDGRTYEECLARDGDQYRAWVARPLDHTPPDGETFDDFAARVDVAWASLPEEGNVLLVVHGGPLRLILARLLDIDYAATRRFALSPCGITRADLYPDGIHILCVNDTAHMGATQ